MRTRSLSVALLVAVCAAAPARAEIRASASNGFEVASFATVKASPAMVYAAIGVAGR